MSIKNLLEPLTAFLPLNTLEQAVEVPSSIFPEEVRHVIPAIALGSDGPFIRSLFLIGDHYLCEVILSAADHKFDFMTLRSAYNYRVEFGTHNVQLTESSSITYETATVTLSHTGSIFSTISYVGDDRAKWMKAVQEALPVSILSDGR